MADKSNIQENLSKLSLEADVKRQLLQSIEEPGRVAERDWKRLVDVLVSKGMRNTKESRIAARICNDVAQAEFSLLHDNQPRYFRPFLLTKLQGEYKKHMGQNCQNMKAWIGFVNFLCAVFDLMHINNMPLMALLVPVFEVLGILSDIRFANNEDAIQCMVTQLQFVGEELDRLNKHHMEDLMQNLRNLFLSDKTSQLSRLMLLEIIELRSGGWKLSPSAYHYYYEETAK
uniref:MIF4G domain-containing protein-like n=1 Tax=Phallusia mammillata TaxID=59560 RepID=A0A6F9DLH4_9ASCI|nr:MIF4G domain-containing protein-like [Phallusia mammillata]